MPGTADRREEAQDAGVLDILELPLYLTGAGADVLDLLHLPAEGIRCQLLFGAELAFGVAEFIEVTDFVDGGIRLVVDIGIGIDFPIHTDIFLPVVGFLVLRVVKPPRAPLFRRGVRRIAVFGAVIDVAAAHVGREEPGDPRRHPVAVISAVLGQRQTELFEIVETGGIARLFPGTVESRQQNAC
mgnify:CR=1 FL=1